MPTTCSCAKSQLPDFIIGGAMKSGTSSLHTILSSHPGVYIPEGEIHFFSVDDITEHFQFFGRVGGEWIEPSYRTHFKRNLAWYQDFFEPAEPDQLIGEDSTIYLASEKAAPRIAELIPDVKLLFLLRDPVERTHSQYRHMLRTGRALLNFEDTLQYHPGTLITRSFYRQQLERYLDHFDRDQIHVVIFEDFVENTQQGVDEVCAFLGLRDSVDVNRALSHANASPVPRWPRLLIWQNWLFRTVDPKRHAAHLPGLSPPSRSFRDRVLQSLDHRLRYLNLQTDRPAPSMDPNTRAHLQTIFARENAGLSDLIGIDVARFWPYM